MDNKESFWGDEPTSTSLFGVPFSQALRGLRFRGRKNMVKLRQNRVWACGKVPLNTCYPIKTRAD